MGNFGSKWDKFVQIFIEKNGYVKVVQGLQNTILIAIAGMLIGVLIGTIIATIRVLPKYRTLPRALNAVCTFTSVCSAELRWWCSSWCSITLCCRL